MGCFERLWDAGPSSPYYVGQLDYRFPSGGMPHSDGDLLVLLPFYYEIASMYRIGMAGITDLFSGAAAASASDDVQSCSQSQGAHRAPDRTERGSPETRFGSRRHLSDSLR